MGSGGPVGPGVIGMSGPLPNSRYVGIGSAGLASQGSHYSSSLLNNPNPSKFNTIHSSVNKRNHNPLNHYESAVNRNMGGNGSYHLSTLSRSSSVRGGNGGNGSGSGGGARDPLLPSSGSSSAGSGTGVQKLPQTAKVVDSAYGTTRSSKKVYL